MITAVRKLDRSMWVRTDSMSGLILFGCFSKGQETSSR